MVRRTIDASGNLVEIGDGSSSNGRRGGESENLLSTFQSMQTMDVFGFNIPAKQFYIGLAVVALMIGLRGALGVLMALGCYHLCTRSTSGSSGGSGRWSARGGGSWRGGGGGGGGGGSNIRGMSDLPCDPKVG